MLPTLFGLLTTLAILRAEAEPNPKKIAESLWVIWDKLEYLHGTDLRPFQQKQVVSGELPMLPPTWFWSWDEHGTLGVSRMYTFVHQRTHKAIYTSSKALPQDIRRGMDSSNDLYAPSLIGDRGQNHLYLAGEGQERGTRAIHPTQGWTFRVLQMLVADAMEDYTNNVLANPEHFPGLEATNDVELRRMVPLDLSNLGQLILLSREMIKAFRQMAPRDVLVQIQEEAEVLRILHGDGIFRLMDILAADPEMNQETPRMNRSGWMIIAIDNALITAHRYSRDERAKVWNRYALRLEDLMLRAELGLPLHPLQVIR